MNLCNCVLWLRIYPRTSSCGRSYPIRRHLSYYQGAPDNISGFPAILCPEPADALRLGLREQWLFKVTGLFGSTHLLCLVNGCFSGRKKRESASREWPSKSVRAQDRIVLRERTLRQSERDCTGWAGLYVYVCIQKRGRRMFQGVVGWRDRHETQLGHMCCCMSF